MILNQNLMVENVIKIKSGITINVDATGKVQEIFISAQLLHVLVKSIII